MTYAQCSTLGPAGGHKSPSSPIKKRVFYPTKIHTGRYECRIHMMDTPGPSCTAEAPPGQARALPRYLPTYPPRQVWS